MLKRQCQNPSLHKKKGKRGLSQSKRVSNWRLAMLSSQDGWLSIRDVIQRRPRRVGSDENLGGRKRKSSSLGRRILRRMDEGHSAARCKLTLPMRLGRNGLPRGTVACVRQNLPTFDEWVRTPSERREQAEQGWPHRISSGSCGFLHPTPACIQRCRPARPCKVTRSLAHWSTTDRHVLVLRTCAVARGTLWFCQPVSPDACLVSLLALTIMQRV